MNPPVIYIHSGGGGCGSVWRGLGGKLLLSKRG